MTLNAALDRLTLLGASIELLGCSLDLEDWFDMLVGLGDKLIKDFFFQKGCFSYDDPEGAMCVCGFLCT